MILQIHEVVPGKSDNHPQPNFIPNWRQFSLMLYSSPLLWEPWNMSLAWISLFFKCTFLWWFLFKSVISILECLVFCSWGTSSDLLNLDCNLITFVIFWCVPKKNHPKSDACISTDNKNDNLLHMLPEHIPLQREIQSSPFHNNRIWKHHLEPKQKRLLNIFFMCFGSICKCTWNTPEWNPINRADSKDRRWLSYTLCSERKLVTVIHQTVFWLVLVDCSKDSVQPVWIQGCFSV